MLLSLSAGQLYMGLSILADTYQLVQHLIQSYVRVLVVLSLMAWYVVDCKSASQIEP